MSTKDFLDHIPDTISLMNSIALRPACGDTGIVTIALLVLCVAHPAQAKALLPANSSNSCAQQIADAQDGHVKVSTSLRRAVVALKQRLNTATFQDAYRAGAELLNEPEFADDATFEAILGVLGQPDLLWATDDGKTAEVFYKTNGGPVNVAFQQCRLIHKAMQTPAHWGGTDTELARLWAKVRRSREWWLWQPMTGTLAPVVGPLSRLQPAPTFEVNLEGGMLGEVGNLSFKMLDGDACSGRWSVGLGPGSSGFVVTSGRLVS